MAKNCREFGTDFALEFGTVEFGVQDRPLHYSFPLGEPLSSTSPIGIGPPITKRPSHTTTAYGSRNRAIRLIRQIKYQEETGTLLSDLRNHVTLRTFQAAVAVCS